MPPTTATLLDTNTAVGIDPLGFAQTHLSDGALTALDALRVVLERDVQPLMATAWDAATMPAGVLDALVPLDLMQRAGVTAEEADSSMFAGFSNYLLARTDT